MHIYLQLNVYLLKTDINIFILIVDKNSTNNIVSIQNCRHLYCVENKNFGLKTRLRFLPIPAFHRIDNIQL